MKLLRMAKQDTEKWSEENVEAIKAEDQHNVLGSARIDR